MGIALSDHYKSAIGLGVDGVDLSFRANRCAHIDPLCILASIRSGLCRVKRRPPRADVRPAGSAGDQRYNVIFCTGGKFLVKQPFRIPVSQKLQGFLHLRLYGTVYRFAFAVSDPHIRVSPKGCEDIVYCKMVIGIIPVHGVPYCKPNGVCLAVPIRILLNKCPKHICDLI